jgi:hypothetical protein
MPRPPIEEDATAEQISIRMKRSVLAAIDATIEGTPLTRSELIRRTLDRMMLIMLECTCGAVADHPIISRQEFEMWGKL